MTTLTTCLTFDKNLAEEATAYYLATFESGKIVRTTRPSPDAPVLAVEIELFGATILALNGGPMFSFAPGISLVVTCETQAEIDRYWAKLTDGGEEQPCGWCRDRYGVSWQIVPRGLVELVAKPAGFAAMMKMKKLDIATLKNA